MAFSVQGKVALITGAASGLGYQFAKEILKKGGKGVAILDVQADKGEYVQTELRNEFGADSCIFIKTDVSDSVQMEGAFQTTTQFFKQLDIVINNAGIGSEANWRTTINVNLVGCITGTLLALDTFLPQFKCTSDAVVINIASATGIDPIGAAPVYSASKSGIIGFSRAYGLKEHYERTKVRVITLCPGYSDSSMKVDGYYDLFKEAMEIYSPIKQTAEWVAENLITILENGITGSVWIVQDNQCACEIEFPDRHMLRKK